MLRMTVVLLALSLGSSAWGEVITGNIVNWADRGGGVLTIGDESNHVSIFWSLASEEKSGWFYGSNHTGDSDVAFATGITDVTQISDASAFDFSPDFTGPHRDAGSDPDGVGDFVVWKNVHTGHFGVLRIDDVHSPHPDAYLDGTWWFQTDGTGTFAPEPSTALLQVCALGALGLVARRRSGRHWS